MAVPAGYELLARIGFVDKGTYAAGTTYMAGDVVYYNGSTWTALKDNLKGVTPAQGANWRYMARGFAAELLSDVTAKDTEGLAGTAGASVGAQVLMDAIADKVATKLLLKSDVVNQIINDATKAASAASLYNVNQAVTQLNSNLTGGNLQLRSKLYSGAAASGIVATSRNNPVSFENVDGQLFAFIDSNQIGYISTCLTNPVIFSVVNGRVRMYVDNNFIGYVTTTTT